MMHVLRVFAGLGDQRIQFLGHLGVGHDPGAVRAPGDP